MEPLSLGAKAGLALWGGAVAWDFVYPKLFPNAKKQTISEAVARGLRNPHTRVPITCVIVMSVTHIVALAILGWAEEEE